MHCMEMTFRLYEADHNDSLFPGVQLLIFGESNYVSVHYRESKTLDKYGPWQHLSCHDSCWRSDGVDRFLSLFKDRIATLGWHDGIGSNTWYTKREISEKEAKELREITKQARSR